MQSHRSRAGATCSGAVAILVKLGTLKPKVAPLETRRVLLPAKQSEPHYLTREHKAWAADVVFRAGARCEAVEGGARCTKAAPQHRMFADHVVELRDGGAALDPDNGQCLCGSHHTAKTAAARAKRMRAGG